MEKRYNIQNSGLVETAAENSSLIVFITPDANESNVISQKYNIDKHTLESALDPDEISRIEIDGDDIFIIWKRPKNYISTDNFLFGVSSIGLFYFKEKLIIVLPEDIPLFDTKTHYPINSLWDVITNFLNNSIKHYLEHIKAIRLISREIQVKINTSMENEYLIQMFNLSESLIYYINAISSNQSVLIKLRNHFEKLNIMPEIAELLEDISIENNQCSKQAEIHSSVLSGLMDARGNIINNNMNVLLKNLTIINIIFLPLNLLASIGGMSEYSMMTFGIDWRLSYGVFLFSMVIIGWITLRILKRVSFVNKSSSIIRRSLYYKLKSKMKK
ncbi:MAG TPA: magnesium transporter CorA family protein [Ignavibacteria bacterium]|nr:magnesium transporter CorA family protein [Ignavibacteria bacterium]